MFNSPTVSKIIAVFDTLLCARFYPYMKVPPEDLHGRTAIVTGANTGIGLESARKLASMGARVVLACRDLEKGAAAQRDILSDSTINAGLVSVEKLDLSDSNSVRDFLERWDQKPLDILINNAGASSNKYLQAKNTTVPLELLYYVNLLAPVQLTLGLLPAFTPGARIVNLSSIAQYDFSSVIPTPDIDCAKHIEKTWGYKIGDTWTSAQCTEVYQRIKLMNVVFTKELQKRLDASARYGSKKITTYTCHPGLVQTTMHTRSDGLFSGELTSGDRTFLKMVASMGISPEQGSCTPVYLAVSPSALSGKGGYFDRMTQRTPNALVENVEMRRALWQKWLEQLEIAEPL